MSSSVTGTFKLMMHQAVPNFRLIDFPVPTRACQSSGPLSSLWNKKLCQFSANLVLAALFLLVEDSVIEPRIHLLVGGGRSGKVVKAMKCFPFADFYVPTS